jgi:hypothetical protein
MIEPQAAPAEPVKITTELLDYLDGLYAGTVTPTGPVLIPVPELVAAARLGAAWAEYRDFAPFGGLPPSLSLGGNAADATAYLLDLIKKLERPPT